MEGYEHSYTILQEGGLLATEECFILKAHLKACIVDKNWVGIKGIVITFMHHIYSVNDLFIFLVFLYNEVLNLKILCEKIIVKSLPYTELCFMFWYNIVQCQMSVN